MKKLLIAAVAALTLAGPAFAHSLPGANPKQDANNYERCLRELDQYYRDLALGKNARLRPECVILLGL